MDKSTQQHEFNLIIRFLEDHGGKVYKPGLAKEIQRGDVGKCYDTCILNAMRGPYRYVEGLAKLSGGPWIMHSWLTDGVHAYDPTWSADKDGDPVPVPAIYFGVEMDHKAVVEFMLSTKYCGVFANAWRDHSTATMIDAHIPNHRFRCKQFEL